MMKIDLHSHTIYSRHRFWGHDAINTPEQMIKAAIQQGLSGLAITDHDTVRGSLVGDEIAKRKYKDFIIIPGSEIKSEKGDILGLGIRENVPKGLGVEETVDRIHDLGGIAVAAHPFSRYPWRKCLKEECLKTDAIEVFNSRSGVKTNLKTLEFAKKYRKPKTASSDAHWAWNVGFAGVVCDNGDVDDILESIRKGRVKIFGKYTPFWDISFMLLKKFTRSFNWRILRRKPLELKKIGF